MEMVAFVLICAEMACAWIRRMSPQSLVNTQVQAGNVVLIMAVSYPQAKASPANGICI